MARVLIIGYGNPLRSDDGLGWYAAVQLFRSSASRDVEVLPCHQLTPDLAEPISHADTVVFLDSTHEGKPGELRCAEIEPAEGSASFSHHLSPQLVLAIARDLYGAFPRAWLLTVCGRYFEAGETLSAEVERRLPDLRAKVREVTTQTLGSCPIAG
jgi:hydrogenase maturation protease